MKSCEITAVGRLKEDERDFDREQDKHGTEVGKVGGNEEGAGDDGVGHGQVEHHLRAGARLSHWTEDESPCLGQESRNNRGRPFPPFLFLHLVVLG